MTDINEISALNDPAALLDGCADSETAQTRAHEVIGRYVDTGEPAHAYWTEQAERIFAALLHAAALDDDLTAHDVADWLIDPDDMRDQIENALARIADRRLLLDAQQFMTTNPRTRTSLCTTILTAQARAMLAAQESA